MDKLDSRFAAILNQCRVPAATMKLMGDKDVDSMGVFGHIASTEQKLELFCKRVLNLDPETRGEDTVPVARLTMAWEQCRKRGEIET